MTVVKGWISLLTEVVESPSVEIFKTHLDRVLGNCLKLTLLEQRVWSR